ncbi:protein Mpv17 [Marchantia polymorpha subsp. ruderalis]|uniref:Uncharacterized protein n=1 Tax=Marchantia polymorpha TaxID=3197 RepID=A0A2R6XII6_MARPO|nr:hypothetical protein MARPO_0013s0132 [Marchantia polymorpha]BBN18919.1 hypothetical protein Mp_8g06600 [Marchantia polymorpha subsp. ruderalis]|eukprot:PTQ45927.1 hypothetical protein MARPO_0013s0132 [Marchantia polymorpha]
MAGALGGLRGFWSWYQGSLARQPVRTQVVTSGLLWAVGDVMAQTIEIKTQRSRREKSPAVPHAAATPPPEGDLGTITTNQTLNLRRVATTSLFGFGFVGPVGHFWYEALEHIVKSKMRLVPNSLAFVATKVVVDTLLFGPIHLVTFFTYAGLASGKPFEQVKKDLKRDFVPTFMIEGSTWFFVQIANFRFVPVQHQLLFVNFFCILDSAFLSWVKHQEDAPWKRYLTALGSSKNVKEQ